MASQIIAETNDGPRPLQTTPVGETWMGGRVTNTEAKRLVSELLDWAGQFHHPEAQKLTQGLKDIEKLFSVVATEIDEALTLLNFAEKGYGDPSQHRKTAMSYLHRWQDRGGRVGNVL